jgi:hypothetical protein
MADSTTARQSYPYMSPTMFATIRGKLRQSRPTAITVDWLASVLNVSEKAAKNTFPQLRAMGLVTTDGNPSAIADDLRVDETYTKACEEIIESTYPTGLREAFHNADDADAGQVSSWFMRNANTGELTAERQARLYLYLLKGEMGESSASVSTTRPATKTVKKAPAKKITETKDQQRDQGHQNDPPAPKAPNLHIDVQIHIAADARDEQIEAIFSSMAKHLYGR